MASCPTQDCCLSMASQMHSYLSKLLVNGKLSKANQVVQGKPSCPRQTKLSKANQVVQGKPSCPRQTKLSKANQVVQGKPSCPRQTKLSNAWLLVSVKSSKSRQVVQVEVDTCQWQVVQGHSSMAGLLAQGCLSMITRPSHGYLFNLF